MTIDTITLLPSALDAILTAAFGTTDPAAEIAVAPVITRRADDFGKMYDWTCGNRSGTIRFERSAFQPRYAKTVQGRWVASLPRGGGALESRGASPEDALNHLLTWVH